MLCLCPAVYFEQQDEAASCVSGYAASLLSFGMFSQNFSKESNEVGHFD
jgi:hypothetical protein